MKKIIYSLVIMIAAGSLFTSCVNYEEPVGVQDLREAKASYLDALSALRAADAELQLAYAEVQKSIAAKNNADAAYRNAQVEYQKLVNAAKEISNATDKAQSDQKIAEAQKLAAKAKAEAEEAAKVHAINMANLEKQLSDLQKKIDAESLGLTAAEKNAVQDAINYYTTALGLYNTAAGEVATAEQKLYAAENGFGASKTEAQFTDSLNKAIETEKANIAAAQATIEAITSNETLKDWQDYLAELKAEKDQNNFLKTQYKADSTVIASTDLVDAKANALKEVYTWVVANMPTVRPATVKAKWEVPAWATAQATGTYASKFATIMKAYLDELDSEVNVLSDDEEYIYLEGSTESVDALLNGYQTETPSVKNIGLKGVIAAIEDSDLLKSDSTQVKKLKSDAEKAKKAYEDDLAFLKVSRPDYAAADSAVKAAVADTLKAFEQYQLDTAAAKAAADSVIEVVKKDTANVSKLFAAREALAQAAKDINDEGTVTAVSYSSADVTPLLEAVKAFVAAKQAVFGEQSTDTLSYYKEGTLVPTLEKVAIEKLEASDLVQTIDSIKVDADKIYFKVSNQFTKLQPYQSESVLGGFVNNSYQVVYTYSGTFEATSGWVKYADSLATKYSITSGALANARLSKPVKAEEADEVFTVIFKALGLVPSFWYSSAPATELATSWYETVLNPSSAYAADLIFNFGPKGNVSEPSIGITTEPSFAPYKIFAFDGTTYSPVQPKSYTDALTAASQAQTKADNSEIAFGKEKDTLANAVAAAYNKWSAVYNRFFGKSIHSTWTAAEIAATSAASFKADHAEFAKDVADAEYFAKLVKDYIIEDPLTGKIYESVVLKVAAAMDQFKRNYTVDQIVDAYYASAGEFYNYVTAQNKYDAALAWADTQEIMDTLKGWVADAEKAVADAADANKAYNEAWDKYSQDLLGLSAEELIEETNNSIFAYHNTIVSYISDELANNFYNLLKILYKDYEIGGKLAEIYDTYFAEIDETLYLLGEYIEIFDTRNAAIDKLVGDINGIIAKYLDDNSDVVSNSTDIAAAVEQLVDDQKNKINTAQGNIDNAEAALAKLAAGVDPKQVAVEGAQRALEAAQAKLAAAEEVLAIAKAQYDAVIAKYVK